LIYRLVWENLKHRPVRTLLSAVFIGVQVTLILTLVGLSVGTLGEMQKRARGTGADIMIRPPNSTAFSFSQNIKNGEKYVEKVRQAPHVALATGTLVEKVGDLDNLTGIHLDEFNAMSGGFHYFEGGPFQRPDDILVDQDFARSKKLHVGDILQLSLPWHVCGVVQSGMLSRMFAQIDVLRDKFSATGEVTVILVKVDQSGNIDGVKENLKQMLPDFNIYTMEEFVSLLTADNYPLIKGFTNVVVGISVIVGFLVVFLTMYTAVLERTREIGILKALGASPGYVLGILVREAVVLSIIGAIAGIVMTYGTRWLMYEFAPASLTQVIVYDWWPRAGLIALIGALLGSIYPGLKAARQDAIEALSYD
jgi:putative ABC transport system permease protein